jgi:hypothetical protein
MTSRAGFAFPGLRLPLAALKSILTPMPCTPITTSPEMRRMVRGYEVVVRTTPGLVLITCPDLPQLAVQAETLSAALAFAEDLIGASLAGRHARTEETR